MAALDIGALEKVARAATPGPWTGKVIPEPYPESDDADLPFVVLGADGKMVVYLPERYVGGADQHECDGEFIATFDPPTVLRLLADRRALLAALKALDEAILRKAESNASGNPEWEYVSARVNAARAAIALAGGA